MIKYTILTYIQILKLKCIHVGQELLFLIR